MPRITRRLEFDAGHRVLGHESKCARLHGHRYVTEVTVEAPELDTLGRVVDFSVIKQLVGGWVDEHWDHNLLLHPQDPLLALVELASQQRWPRSLPDVFAGKSPYIFPDCNPTAENIARILFGVADKLLPAPLRVVDVRIWETPNCSASYPCGG